MRIHMKRFLTFSLSLILVCCGPSDEEKKTARDLTNEIVEMVNALQGSLQRIDDASAQLSTAIVHAESFRMRYQKDSTALAKTATRLRSEKDRLVALKNNVGEWVRKYRPPDLNQTGLGEAVSTLKRDREQLIAAGNEIQTGMESVQTAMDEYYSTVFVMADRKKMKKDAGSKK